MKLGLLLLTALCSLALAQDQGMSEVGEFAKGFVSGLHFERLSPTIQLWCDYLSTAAKAFSEAMGAYNEHQPFYNFMNNVTLAFGTVPPVCRTTAKLPAAIMDSLEQTYFKKFNYSWEAYLYAAFLNLGFRMDEIIYNVLKVKSFFEQKDFLNSGYHCGTTINIMINVTSARPVPPPPPVDDDLPMRVNANWTDIHNNFRTYFNYSMITLNYTKWINATTANNLNSSVMDIEMKGYTAITLLNDANTMEGILTFIDVLSYVNTFFNGIYYTIQQLPVAMTKDTIFEHLAYAGLNQLLHVGYYAWNGWKLYGDFSAKEYDDVPRRIAIIFRRIIYFDEDTLDEINNGVDQWDV